MAEISVPVVIDGAAVIAGRLGGLLRSWLSMASAMDSQDGAASRAVAHSLRGCVRELHDALNGDADG